MSAVVRTQPAQLSNELAKNKLVMKYNSGEFGHNMQDNLSRMEMMCFLLILNESCVNWRRFFK